MDDTSKEMTPREDAINRAKIVFDKLHAMRDEDPSFDYENDVPKLVASAKNTLKQNKELLEKAMATAIGDLEFGCDATNVVEELKDKILQHEREYAFASTFIRLVRDEQEEGERKKEEEAHEKVLEKQREFLKNRKPSDKPLTFRQLIESVEAFSDQDCCPNLRVDTLNDFWWGVHEISFKDGVLSIKGYDDEGDWCKGIAKNMRKCIPEDMLDKPALVKVGKDDWENGTDEVVDQDENPVKACSVKDSIVTFYDKDEAGEEEEGYESTFCKWRIELGD